MSILIDQLIRQDPFSAQQEIGNRWYIAKSLNDKKGYKPFRNRIKDAWRVFQCRSIAVHYKEDEVSNE